MRQYVPMKVVATWVTPGPFGTIDIVDGHIEDSDFFNTTKDNPTWAREHDGAGNATRVKNDNEGGSVTVVIGKSSPTNAQLSGVVALDRVSENQVGILTFKDMNGSTIGVCEDAFLEDEPEAGFGATRGSNSWTWQCSSIRKFIGGHDTV